MHREHSKSGISPVGELPWGTHLCHFYETTQDLLDVVIPYFKAGLENHEYCLWVVSKPLNKKDARHALRQAVPDIDRRLAAGDMEVVSHKRWYLKSDVFDLKRLLNGWKQKLAEALEKGYAGMRANGQAAWTTWNDFAKYEREVNKLIANQRLILLCTYPLAVTKGNEVFDVAKSHQFAIAKRRGKWEILETQHLIQAKDEIKRLNVELEHEVDQRTSELVAANHRLQVLSRRVVDVQEEERRHLARELHDEIGQVLSAVSVNLLALRGLSDATNGPRLEESIDIINQAIQRVRDLSLDLRPSMLDNLGLASTLQWYANGQAQRAGFALQFVVESSARPLPADLKIGCYRVAQEALTNIVRHAQAHHVWLEFHQDDDAVELMIRDDGIGFDLAAARQRAAHGRSFGVLGMQERVELLGGQLDIESTPACGTTIRARFPAPSTSRKTGGSTTDR